jgi:hypothetical protein
VSARVDSWENPRRPYGSVAEYDETNNIRGEMGPDDKFFLWLPISVKVY